MSLLGFNRVCFRKSFSLLDKPNKLFHSCCSRNSFKQSKMLNKLLTKGKSRKKVYFNPVDFSSNSISAPPKEKKYKINPSKTRRAEQVSKVLFSHISDLIQYGNEDFPEIEEHIEISKVKISPDFSALSVYWVATGTEKDDIIQQKLVKYSSKIRHDLIHLHYVGTLPPITFIPDFSEMQYQKMMDLLKTADMGPGEEKPSVEELMKQQPKISSKYIGVSLKKQIKDDLDNLSEPLSLHEASRKNYELLQSNPETFNVYSSKTEYDLEKINSVKSQFENNAYQLDHSYLMKLVQEKQCSQRRIHSEFEASEELFVANQKIMEKYYQKTSKKKEHPPKLKEYTYVSYLKEKDMEINDEE